MRSTRIESGKLDALHWEGGRTRPITHPARCTSRNRQHKQEQTSTARRGRLTARSTKELPSRHNPRQPIPSVHSGIRLGSGWLRTSGLRLGVFHQVLALLLLFRRFTPRTCLTFFYPSQPSHPSRAASVHSFVSLLHLTSSSPFILHPLHHHRTEAGPRSKLPLLTPTRAGPRLFSLPFTPRSSRNRRRPSQRPGCRCISAHTRLALGRRSPAPAVPRDDDTSPATDATTSTQPPIMYPAHQHSHMPPPQPRSVQPETFLLDQDAQQSLPQDSVVALQQVDNRTLESEMPA